jgi:hypothetical protein
VQIRSDYTPYQSISEGSHGRSSSDISAQRKDLLHRPSSSPAPKPV